MADKCFPSDLLNWHDWNVGSHQKTARAHSINFTPPSSFSDAMKLAMRIQFILGPIVRSPHKKCCQLPRAHLEVFKTRVLCHRLVSCSWTSDLAVSKVKTEVWNDFVNSPADSPSDSVRFSMVTSTQKAQWKGWKKRTKLPHCSQQISTLGGVHHWRPLCWEFPEEFNAQVVNDFALLPREERECGSVYK